MATMISWLEQPLNTMVTDYEFLNFSNWTKEGFDQAFPVQVAATDGYGCWIIPPFLIMISQKGDFWKWLASKK